jgi:hypothetical protein
MDGDSDYPLAVIDATSPAMAATSAEAAVTQADQRTSPMPWVISDLGSAIEYIDQEHC